MTKRKEQFYNEQTGMFANQTKTIMKRVEGGLIRKSYEAAAKSLSPAAFKMYMCACMDSEGWVRIWKNQDFEDWGVTKTSYYRGLQELKEKGYIAGGIFNPGAGLNPSDRVDETAAEYENWTDF